MNRLYCKFNKPTKAIKNTCFVDAVKPYQGKTSAWPFLLKDQIQITNETDYKFTTLGLH
ncbi:hypothetical protein RchiOBHm_Chr2g0106791 [Rosa chinensis]|uniref:Uncharacterized protein n=1 Tax=Rosa chinensis TaxID=74649 RepID=A0A2P6RNS5_ROSCH|nr:hypothetical protein RchiOBHm_Chr2g0106791 [Rosa chinensis]